jgi:thiamine transport system ATP-binding protein
MLSVEQLSVAYADFTALHPTDLTVGDGETVCVLGPSGGGKSTLLRAIAGLLPEAQGRVSWDDRNLCGVPPHQRGFGLMFQDHALFPHRDVAGNVAFGLRMQRLPREEVARRTRQALERVGLAGFDHRRVAELSGGEQQRVALARALAPAPRLLMLDEPLGALDRALRDRLVAELRSLFVQLGLAALFVTHDHDEAFALADRLIVLHEGRIEQVGAPRDVWRAPATAFVARFLGWNVTTAFGGRLAAMRPDALHFDHDEERNLASVTGSTRDADVVGRTFQRDHFSVEVRLHDTADVLKVAVPVDGAEPPTVGDPVSIRLDPRGVVDLTE